MMPVIAEYTFKMFLTFYILQAGPPNIARPWLTYPLTLPLNRSGCVNHAIINCVKEITAVR